MKDRAQLDYVLKNQLELNLSYMPFIKDGGLFVPSNETFSISEKITLNLQLPGQKESHLIEGKVIWITPKNALYQIFPGVGVQFIGDNAKSIHEQIKTNLDNTMDVGGYTYGITDMEKNKSVTRSSDSSKKK
jgi:type IV pilus assembly protein PilZ